MKKINNWENIQESTSFKRLPTGGYIIKILNVENVEDKEYLKISFDIAKGDNKGFFAEEFKNDQRKDKKWPNGGSFVRSYKDSAASMFKGFVGAVERSNKGYEWNWQEQSLKNKLVGIVVGEEEYQTQKGAVRTRTYVSAVRSVDVIEKGDFQIPELKKLDTSKIASAATASSEPFKNPFDNDDSDPFASGAPATSNEEMTNPWDDDSNPFA